MSFSNGKTVSYQYDAVGRKLDMSTSTRESRDYVGLFRYLNGNLFEVAHKEGRVVPGSPNTYEYYHKDHLGNIRLGRHYGGGDQQRIRWSQPASGWTIVPKDCN